MLVSVLHRGAPFFSFIIGLGVAVMVFHRDFGVMKTFSLPIRDTTEKIVRANGKCYRYRVEDADCEIPSSS